MGKKAGWIRTAGNVFSNLFPENVGEEVWAFYQRRLGENFNDIQRKMKEITDTGTILEEENDDEFPVERKEDDDDEFLNKKRKF